MMTCFEPKNIFSDLNFIYTALQIDSMIGRFEKLQIIRRAVCVPEFPGFCLSGERLSDQ